MREFATLSALGEGVPAVRGLDGFEVGASALAAREGPLPQAEERRALIRELRAMAVRRIHGSYWGSPTAFHGKLGHDDLRARFADEQEYRAYFGDGSGRHQFARWTDEYRLARELGAEVYVFHLIDYATVDGAWAFSQTREEVLAALAAMLQQLLVRLDEAGLLEGAGALGDAGPPRIELENAGWGLEYGMQTADDAARVLDAVDDPHGVLRIGWDVNHLLHALGRHPGTGEVCFLLPADELTAEMRALPAEAGSAGGESRAGGPRRSELAHRWLEQQLGDPRLRGRISAVHLSDCALKDREYFRRGQLDDELLARQRALPGVERRREFGLELVLAHYDSHLPLGAGCLDGARVRALLERLDAENLGFAVLHELKLSRDLGADLTAQREALGTAAEDGAAHGRASIGAGSA